MDAEPTTNRPDVAGVADGCLAPQTNAQSLSAFRSGFTVHQHRLGIVSEAAQYEQARNRRVWGVAIVSLRYVARLSHPELAFIASTVLPAIFSERKKPPCGGV